jgi:fructokinase
VSASLTEPVLVLGEALIDLVHRPGEPENACVGGSPLNVAIGLSRLGVPAVLHTRIGPDEHGRMITDYLAANDVALTPGSIVTGTTSTALATIGTNGAATYDFDIHWSLEPVEHSTPRSVHTGSIAAVVEPGGSAVAETVRALRPSATISYDPNVRPQLMGNREDALERIESIVCMADVVKASDEDLAWLHPGVDPHEVARRWCDLGAALVVVTHGELGAYAVGQAAHVRIPAPATDLVDTIGAGDSFMAGLLAALDAADLLGREREHHLRALDQAAMRALVEFAAACAAVTVSRAGANPPHRDVLPFETLGGVSAAGPI